MEVFHEMHAADIQAAHKAQRQALRMLPADTKPGATITIPNASYNPPPASTSSSSSTTIPNIFNTSEERQMLLNVILHCADISNPARPTMLAEKYVFFTFSLKS